MFIISNIEKYDYFYLIYNYKIVYIDEKYEISRTTYN